MTRSRSPLLGRHDQSAEAEPFFDGSQAVCPTFAELVILPRYTTGCHGLYAKVVPLYVWGPAIDEWGLGSECGRNLRHVCTAAKL